MKKKVLIGYVVAAIVVLIAFEYAFWTNGFSYMEHQSEKSFLTQAELLRELMLEKKASGTDLKL